MWIRASAINEKSPAGAGLDSGVVDGNCQLPSRPEDLGEPVEDDFLEGLTPISITFTSALPTGTTTVPVPFSPAGAVAGAMRTPIIAAINTALGMIQSPLKISI